MTAQRSHSNCHRVTTPPELIARLSVRGWGPWTPWRSRWVTGAQGWRPLEVAGAPHPTSPLRVCDSDIKPSAALPPPGGNLIYNNPPHTNRLLPPAHPIAFDAEAVRQYRDFVRLCRWWGCHNNDSQGLACEEFRVACALLWVVSIKGRSPQKSLT